MPYPSAIRVTGLARGRLTDVNLRLQGLSHTYPDDLDLLLMAPGGRNAVVMSDVGGKLGVVGVNLSLDDEMGGFLPDEAQLVDGHFGPTDFSDGPDAFPAPAPAPSGRTVLAGFDGIDPNGTWKLYVLDDTAGAAGTLAGWSLRITARVPR